jgi:hypothetical protein
MAERAATAAVTFINIYYVGFTPFLMFYILGTVYMSTPYGQNFRRGRSTQAAMDEIYQMARNAGYAVVVVQVRMARCAGSQAGADCACHPPAGAFLAAFFPLHCHAGGERHALVRVFCAHRLPDAVGQHHGHLFLD